MSWIRYSLVPWFRDQQEAFLRGLARHLPRSLRYWVVIVEAAPFGTAPDAITVLDLLRQHKK